jgi:hypothetical protein
MNQHGKVVIAVAAGLALAGLLAIGWQRGDISQPNLNSLGLFLLATGVGLMTVKFWRRQDTLVRQKEAAIRKIEEEKSEVTRKAEELAEQHEELQDRVIVLERQLAVVNQSVIPLNAAMQAALIKQLTHFHTPEMDALLVKLADNTLTDQEEVRLWEMVAQRERDMGDLIPEEERDAAHILPIIVKRARAEAAAVEAPAEILLVAVPKEPDPPAEGES